MNLLNSPIVNWALQWAFSRSGVVVRWGIGYLIAWVAGLHIIPGGDLSQISVSLTSGASAVVALAYALLQFWLNKRSADGVNTVKAMLNQSGGKQLKLNGVIGNATVEAASKLSGANVTRAMALAGRPSK
jgi:hypothetical protein